MSEKYRFYVDLPGDFWDQGVMLRYLRSREVQVQWDEGSGQYTLPLEAFNKVLQVKTELQILDPSESWDFLAWITDAGKVTPQLTSCHLSSHLTPPLFDSPSVFT